ncbi:LysR family transcriptional regulator [Psychrobacillus sp. OK032]|uniref:LysR family transcriptional regulator n=1 Tax=Psychrobacillus sp. OK032 TaxID=1884358 RepID=UPI0008BF0872|nr:LysR family transcriptional regulator [Psychrobacillus sp. OK032]SES34895.1 DNA-binding transcriptional regulator, LysR family [Psychrobacillus sp. OK032]
MDIIQIRYFVEVANELNFTSASKKLFVSQAAVSKKIASLEDELGVVLLDRNKRTVKLTSVGQTFYKDAVEIINKMEEMTKKIQNIRSSYNNTLRLGYLGPAEFKFLPSLLQKFNEKHPDINLFSKQYYQGPLIDSLINGHLDIIFSLSMVIEKYPNLAFKKIYSDSFVIYCHKDHRINSKRFVNLSELKKESFIILSKESASYAHNSIIKLCNESGIDSTTISESDNFEHLLMMVKSNKGISILPNSLFNYFNHDNQIITLPIKGDSVINDLLNFDVGVSWEKNHENPAIELLINELMKITIKSYNVY